MLYLCIIFLLIVNSFAMHPLVIVPGYSGSKLEAKLTNFTSDKIFCKSDTDWFLIWLSSIQIIPYVFDCFKARMKLHYDKSNWRKGYNTKGVEIRVFNNSFGSIDAIGQLFNYDFSSTNIFERFLQMFILKGYKNGINLRAAPYDFRHVPDKTYYENLKKLIIDTYNKNNNKSIILFGHSFGGLLSAIFLNMQNDKWINKHINLLITSSSPWAGSVKALDVLINGESYISWLKPEKWKNLLRSYQSAMAFQPSINLWANDEILLTRKKNYTINNYKSIFEQINFENGYQRWKSIKKEFEEILEPRVDSVCIHGRGIDTISKIDYRNTQFPEGIPSYIYETADGTVNERSLTACRNWSNSTFKRDYYVLDTSHNQILKSDEFLALISKYIFPFKERKKLKNNTVSKEDESYFHHICYLFASIVLYYII